MNPSLVLSFYFNILFFSYQYTRNWSGLWAAGCPITGDVFCAVSSPGIASDRPWPTRSKATTTLSRRTRIRFPANSSPRLLLVRLGDNPFLLLPTLASPVPLQGRRLPAVVLGGRVFPIRGVHQAAGDTLFFRKMWGIPCLPTTPQKPTDMHREEVFTSDEPVVTEILIRCMSQ